VVETTGYQKPLDLATDLTSIGGRLIIAGYHQDGLRQVNMQVWNWRGLDIVNAHEREPERYMFGMRQAIDAVASGQIVVHQLITHSVALEDLNDAFFLTKMRPEGFMKAVVIL
jgi:threonine dehydrogenase-like Zn-dependent dehydrogenase